MSFCGGCAGRMLLFPSTQTIDPGQAERHILNQNGRKIEVFIARSPGASLVAQPDAYAIEFCGNATRAKQVIEESAQRWGSRSVEVWAVNYPGYGRSDGPASLHLLSESALTTCDQLRTLAQNRPIFVGGRSIWLWPQAMAR